MLPAGAIVRDAIRAANVGVVFGSPLPGLAVRPTPADVTDILAVAYGRVGPAVAAKHQGGGVLTFGSGPVVKTVRVTSVDNVGDAIQGAADPGVLGIDGTHEVVLDFDLLRPTDASMASAPDRTWTDASEEALEAVHSARRPLALVGPGILAAGHFAGLRTFAAAANLGVLNTWGAKGVFHWRSRHHLATIGLQADDFVLSGLADADLIVTSGLDARESPPERWALARHIDISPDTLAATAERCRRPYAAIEMPTLRERLVGVTAAGWDARSVPVAPSALTRLYGEVLGGEGLVAADPGTAGFFVARTSGTTRPGGVLVPADGELDGFAVAAVISSWLVTPWRRALAVVDDPAEPTTSALLEIGRAHV